MQISRKKISTNSATNTAGIPAKPRTLKGFAADMSNVIGSEHSIMEDDSRFEPPAYDDPETATEIIEFHFEDVQITVLPDSSWDYKDETYQWAAPEFGKYWKGLETGLRLCDAVEMVEHVDDLIISQLPSTPGDYLISGDAEIYFDIEAYVDEDNDFIYDGADITFDYDSSRVINFRCVPD